MEKSEKEKLVRLVERLRRRTHRWRALSAMSLALATVALALVVMLWLQRPSEKATGYSYGNAASRLDAQTLSMLGAAGERVELNASGLRFFDTQGNQLASLAIGDEDKRAEMWLYDVLGRGALGARIVEGGQPEVLLTDREGTYALRLTADEQHSPFLELRPRRGPSRRVTALPAVAPAENEPRAAKDPNRE